MHSLKHFLEGILFSFPESIVELHSISLVLFIFGLYLKVVLLIDGLKKLANIGLYISLLCPEHLLFALDPALLFIIVNNEILVLYLCHSKLVQSLLVGLDKIHHGAVLDAVQNRVLVKQCSLFEAKEELGLMVLEVFILGQLFELSPKDIKSMLVL